MIETMRQNYILGKDFQALPTFLYSNFSWWAQCCHLCLKRSNSLWVRQSCKKAADFRLELGIKVAAKLRRHTISVAEEKSGSDWKAVSFGGGSVFCKHLEVFSSQKYFTSKNTKYFPSKNPLLEMIGKARLDLVNCIALNNHCRLD